MKSKCSQCGEILEMDSIFCTQCGSKSRIKKLNTVERLHSSYSIASLIISCNVGIFFLWLTQVIFYKADAVVDAFAGRYVLRDIIAMSIDGFFILLGIIGLVLGIIGIKRKRTSLSYIAIALNCVLLVVGSYRLLVLGMVFFVF